jgi:hypothetical protein
LTYPHVVSTLALFVALGGTAWALGANSVGSKQIKSDAVKTDEIAGNAVTSPEVKGHSLLKGDFKPGQLVAGAFTESLPSDRTIRGTYAIASTSAGAGQESETNESFAFALAGAPMPHLIAIGGQPTTDCPGSPASPAATPGHLCIYEADRAGLITSITPFDPGQAKASGAGQASRFGFGLRVVADGAGSQRSSGTWAVTAP